MFLGIFMLSESFFLDDPELHDEIPLSYLSHKELYEETIRKAIIVFRKIRQMQSEGKDGVDNYLCVITTSVCCISKLMECVCL